MSTQTKKLGIVEKIMRKLQLGDEGKIGSFFDKQVKKAEKAIRDFKRNQETLKNRYEDDVVDLKDQLQDANEALADAYEAVTPDDVHNNAAMSAFEDVYWSNVKAAKQKVERLTNQIEAKEKSHKEDMEKIDKEIAAWKERITALENK